MYLRQLLPYINFFWSLPYHLTPLKTKDVFFSLVNFSKEFHLYSKERLYNQVRLELCFHLTYETIVGLLSYLLLDPMFPDHPES